jgi:hypothetical protein
MHYLVELATGMRKLQSVAGKRWLLAPDRRLGAAYRSWLRIDRGDTEQPGLARW